MTDHHIYRHPRWPVREPRGFERGDVLVAAPSCWCLEPGSRWRVVGADQERDVYQLRPAGCPTAGYVVVSGPTLFGQVMRAPTEGQP